MKTSDEGEILLIISQFQNGGFGSDEENNAKLEYIERAYPASKLSDLIFWDKRNLTAEQILAEAKKTKPIQL